MKKMAFVAALSVCALTLISLAPAQDVSKPDASKKILPSMRFQVPAAVERTPEQMDAFDATFASPGYVREVGILPTMDAAQYAQMKRAADMAPRMASKPVGLLPNSPLAAVTKKFAGATECDGPGGCWVPPDVAGSIGKSQFVSVSNDVFEVRSRGSVLLQTKSLNGLFGYSTKPMFDPRVQWDEEYQRWIITAAAFPESSTVQIFGIAISKTSSATGSYYVYLLNLNFSGFFGSITFWDYPMLGISQDALLMSSNLFDGCTATGPPCSGFTGAALFSIAKARVYNGFGFSVPVFTGLQATLEPGHQNLTDQNPYAWLAAAPGNSGTIQMYYEGFAANAFSAFLGGPFSVTGVPAYSFPPSASQPAGCGGTLDTLDNRFQNTGTQNGDVYYQVHTENLFGFPAPRYYIITGLLSFAPTVSVTNFVFASATSDDWNPSIASDPQGQFGINWSVTDPGTGLLPTERFADNNGGNPGAGSGLNVFTSASCYNTGGTARWGDYSQVSVDPGPGTVANTNTKVFWIDNETVPSVNFWSTEIANMKY